MNKTKTNWNKMTFIQKLFHFHNWKVLSSCGDQIIESKCSKCNKIKIG